MYFNPLSQHGTFLSPSELPLYTTTTLGAYIIYTLIHSITSLHSDGSCNIRWTAFVNCVNSCIFPCLEQLLWTLLTITENGKLSKRRRSASTSGMTSSHTTCPSVIVPATSLFPHSLPRFVACQPFCTPDYGSFISSDHHSVCVCIPTLLVPHRSTTRTFVIIPTVPLHCNLSRRHSAT